MSMPIVILVDKLKADGLTYGDYLKMDEKKQESYSRPLLSAAKISRTFLYEIERDFPPRKAQ